MFCGVLISEPSLNDERQVRFVALLVKVTDSACRGLAVCGGCFRFGRLEDCSAVRDWRCCCGEDQLQ